MDICHLPEKNNTYLLTYANQKSSSLGVASGTSIMYLYSTTYHHARLDFNRPRPAAIPLRSVGLQRKSASSEIAPGGSFFVISISWQFTTHDRSTGLVYLPTFWLYTSTIHVGKYIPYVDPMGNNTFFK